jgi:hypothetical protein
MHRSGERFWEVELYRLKGELLLRQAVTDSTQALHKEVLADAVTPESSGLSPYN